MNESSNCAILETPDRAPREQALKPLSTSEKDGIERRRRYAIKYEEDRFEKEKEEAESGKGQKEGLVKTVHAAVFGPRRKGRPIGILGAG